MGGNWSLALGLLPRVFSSPALVKGVLLPNDINRNERSEATVISSINAHRDEAIHFGPQLHYGCYRRAGEEGIRSQYLLAPAWFYLYFMFICLCFSSIWLLSLLIVLETCILASCVERDIEDGAVSTWHYCSFCMV
ncbi:hypothetical protein ACQKWADRAFT_295367 [Trichoderma austrokoningii]